MESYSENEVDDFFRDVGITQVNCHAFARGLLTSSGIKAPAIVYRSSSQGTFSYTCIVEAELGAKTVIQFRKEKQDTTGIEEAHRLFGSRAPDVTYRCLFHAFHVYSSPFIGGRSMIDILMDPDQSFGVSQRKILISDLAVFLSGGAKAAPELTLATTLNNFELQVTDHKFDDKDLKTLLLNAIQILRSRSSKFESIPLVFSHLDISAFNYLINQSNDRISAVLDWDRAVYAPIGTNFHFVEELLGSMWVDKGWIDLDGREALEIVFYSRIIGLLADQGFRVNREQLEHQKAVGVLQHYAAFLKSKPQFAERYLKSYMERLQYLHE